MTAEDISRPGGTHQLAPSTATNTLLFGPLDATDAASAVVNRLRAAIALGLLPEGVRLPREADLAAGMGISTFALREALAALREQKLLVTRAGKNGGSFVAIGATDVDAELVDLVDVTAVGLRDLADWRTMLAGRAARLGALRASVGNLDTLQRFAERLARAGSGRDARRAISRFHLELAAAAQSGRLVRAQLAVHEELDLLFGLALGSPEERRASADLLLEIVEAMRRRDPHAARAAAQRQTELLVDRLGQLRLEAIALVRATRPRSSLAGQVRTVMRGLLRVLGGIASDAAAAMGRNLPFDEVRRRLSAATLRRIEDLPDFVVGAGVLAEVGVLPEHPYWIQWARRTSTGPVEDLHHVVDPQDENFYDYASMEFLARPRETHEAFAWGPYVDYGGVDDYVLTVTSPVLARGRFLGVSCADIPVASFEAALAPWLAGARESCLVNGQGRVIAANGLRVSVGDVVTDHRGYDVDAAFPFGWRLLTRPAAS